jgi:hypothetical protein
VLKSLNAKNRKILLNKGERQYYVQYVVAFLNRRDLKRDRLKFQQGFKADIEAAIKPPRAAGLQRLEKRINSAGLEYVLMLDPLNKAAIRGMPGELVLDFGDEKFVFQEHLGGQDFKRDLYWHLYWALRLGQFSTLKKCEAERLGGRGERCPNFFASNYRKARACSQTCYSRLHNAENLKNDYFQKNYLAKKKERLNKASSLREKGEALDVIMEETKLTKLALIRAGIIDEQE